MAEGSRTKWWICCSIKFSVKTKNAPFYLQKKKNQKELFGQPNVSGKYSVSEKFGEGFKENQVSFIELNYNEVAQWHILLIGIIVTK